MAFKFVLLLSIILQFGSALNVQHSTFDLKTDVTSKQMLQTEFTDIVEYLYTNSDPVYKENGKLLAVTVPQNGQVLKSRTNNGFVDTILRAYNEHRHLVLRPDDIWLAITTAFGHYINANSEEMRDKIVNHAGKTTLKVSSGGTLYSADWDVLIEQMSQNIDKNTIGDISAWTEVNFTTSTSTTKTVSRVVLMGILQNYFEYEFHFECGIPKVTLMGSLEDWQDIRNKASVLKRFNVSVLNHWADLLDPVLNQMIKAYSGNVDVKFWSHIVKEDDWGSGGSDPVIQGWLNVFLPFNEKGDYHCQYADPAQNRWGSIYLNEVPQSTVSFPVYINDNGREYNTTFFGGHIVGLYMEEDDSVRSSLDWAIVDITKYGEATDKNKPDVDKSSQDTYKWRDFRQPNKYTSVVIMLSDTGGIKDVSKQVRSSRCREFFDAYIQALVCILTMVFNLFI